MHTYIPTWPRLSALRAARPNTARHSTAQRGLHLPWGSVAAAAFFRQSLTASLQSLPAVRVAGSGALNTSPVSMMHGGTASLHFFRHTLAGAPLPHSMLRTLDLQHAKVEFCPRTFAQVG